MRKIFVPVEKGEAMTKKKDTILVCVKMPGEEPYVDHMPNTLEAFQQVVGGVY